MTALALVGWSTACVLSGLLLWRFVRGQMKVHLLFLMSAVFLVGAFLVFEAVSQSPTNAPEQALEAPTPPSKSGGVDSESGRQ
jgi:hypothetical protein